MGRPPVSRPHRRPLPSVRQYAVEPTTSRAGGLATADPPVPCTHVTVRTCSGKAGTAHANPPAEPRSTAACFGSLGAAESDPMIPTAVIQHLPCRGRLRASVILLHGYAASAQAQRGDGEAFVSEDTEVVLPDAPGHGGREDGRLAHFASLPAERRASAIHALAREWQAELPDLAARCRQRGAARVGVVGISMGGFVALGALATPCPFDAVAAVLAAPNLVDPAQITWGRPPLLLGLAGQDSAVPPDAGRRFARDYGAELHEYPASGHFMRGEDWCDLWGHVTAFLRRQLGPG